jgi:methylphosphotriester-DNA--protein-cysteine methyltransferase
MIGDETFRRLCRARDVAHAFYASRLDTPTLAREAALSPWHFHRLFTAAFGETPHEFLTDLRMARARELLASGRYSVTVSRHCWIVGNRQVALEQESRSRPDAPARVQVGDRAPQSGRTKS